MWKNWNLLHYWWEYKCLMFLSGTNLVPIKVLKSVFVFNVSFKNHYFNIYKYILKDLEV